MRTFTVPQTVDMAPISTDMPPITYSFMSFLGEWVMCAPLMRSDENLTLLFELEDSPILRMAPGDTIEVREELWEKMKAASKAHIDEAMTSRRLHPTWAIKVLRYYHVLASAKSV